MSAKPFHLGWFLNFTAGEWDGPFTSGTPPWNGRQFVDIAQALERACFDYMLIEDTLMVSEVYGGTSRAALKYAQTVPKHDPAPLAAMIAAATRHLGIVATLSTLAYPPFLLARLCATLDHLAEGRFGWNIVTSGEDSAAQNFGLDSLPPRELRYEMADEYMDLVCQLFDSWQPGAIVMDRATGTYSDYTKVKPINFEGKYFKCRGPLNTAPSPQGRPVFVQAGGSPRGRVFAARHSDSVVATANGFEGMKRYRNDIRAHAAACGRNPDEIKILFLIYPILAETREAAYAKHHKLINSPGFIERALAGVSNVTEIDFSRFDLDQPLPELTTNGEQGVLDKFAQWGSGKTLRQLAQERFGGVPAEIELIGTPDDVASRMARSWRKSAAMASSSAPRSNAPAVTTSTRSPRGSFQRSNAAA